MNHLSGTPYVRLVRPVAWSPGHDTIGVGVPQSCLRFSRFQGGPRYWVEYDGRSETAIGQGRVS